MATALDNISIRPFVEISISGIFSQKDIESRSATVSCARCFQPEPCFARDPLQIIGLLPGLRLESIFSTDGNNVHSTNGRNSSALADRTSNSALTFTHVSLWVTPTLPGTCTREFIPLTGGGLFAECARSDLLILSWTERCAFVDKSQFSCKVIQMFLRFFHKFCKRCLWF